MLSLYLGIRSGSPSRVAIAHHPNLAMPLTDLTQAILDSYVEQARSCIQNGQLPNYVPLLARANPVFFATCVRSFDGRIWQGGDVGQPFVLMSAIKPFLLLFLLENSGSEEVFKYVGMQPSDRPFNDLPQLKVNGGKPCNPFVNSGAIALSALLLGTEGKIRCDRLCQWLNQFSGASLSLDRQMLDSVRSSPNRRNRDIAELLSKLGCVDDAETALDTYEHICCLSGTVRDLACLGGLLAGSQPSLSRTSIRTVNAIMTTCGLYELSSAFAVRVGLPSKSGVSGALLAVVPGQGAIACYGPSLDAIGNSVAGLFLVEQLSQSFNLSIFG